MPTSGDFSKAQFVASVGRLTDLPPDTGREVAFAGRSNSGKSSVINALANRRGLARTSKTPGRTQQLIFFRLDEGRRLVDLPGYGYARVPDAVRRHWGELIEGYLSGRASLAGVFLVMDARRPMTRFDLQMLDWCEASGVACHCVLTKADKLGRGEAARSLRGTTDALARREGSFSAQLFSATRKHGVDAGREVLARWLELED